VPAADDAAPISAAEAKTLFAPLADASALVLAISGGPDSTALLVLAARWRAARKRGPKLVAVTIDHGLRAESAGEARAVGRLARRLGVPHRILRWQGKKPATGLQAAARAVRYRLLAAAARTAKADRILTAHTLDDQAETVLIRMSRGSGLTGLCAMAQVSPLPVNDQESDQEPNRASEQAPIALVRPFLDVPKVRLVATLAHAGIDFAHDPSNRDPRFTRARLRDLMPTLAREGLDARRFALLARRARRAEAAIEMAVGVAAQALSQRPWSARGPIVFAAEKFAELPAEVALRLLGRAIAQTGDEGPVELGKLEALYQALGSANADGTSRLRRTLGGALVTLLVTLGAGTLTVERAPARHGRVKDSRAKDSRAKDPARAALVAGPQPRSMGIALTTGRHGGRGGANRR
jgi:tRNA(Ile)-lysidine synthase